jgi:alpha-ketoglutarate-dependent taurine dioxygenase
MNRLEREDVDGTLPVFRRKVVTLSPEAMVRTSFLDPEAGMPLVIQPDVEDVDLRLWLRGNADFIQRKLLVHGAILFRDFALDSVKKLEQVVNSVSPELMRYSEPSTPRTEVSANIYTSTEYPSDQYIPLHNEMSYSSNWPVKLYFYCAQPAPQGGATPIADSRKVFNRIDPKVRERFIEKKLMYVRNYSDGPGLTWQSVFQTDSRKVVEDYCGKDRISCEWREGNRLRTRHIRHSIARHPITGEVVWFNQAHVHHITGLEPSIREALLSMFSAEDYPLDINTCYGDGSPIETQALDAIREAYHRETVSFPWQKGDLLMLDNMLAAHGRESFIGPRKIIVAMAEPFGSNEGNNLIL